MREILFRAWDKNGKGWVNGFNMFGFSTGQGAPKRKLQRFSSEWNEEDFELEQFTGLTDKNGTKIFEGDIISVQSIRFEMKIGEYCPTLLKKFSDDAGYSPNEFLNSTGVYAESINGVHPGEQCFMCQDKLIVEVIGNIHDNPELLGGDIECS